MSIHKVSDRPLIVTMESFASGCVGIAIQAGVIIGWLWDSGPDYMKIWSSKYNLHSRSGISRDTISNSKGRNNNTGSSLCRRTRVVLLHLLWPSSDNWLLIHPCWWGTTWNLSNKTVHRVNPRAHAYLFICWNIRCSLIWVIEIVDELWFKRIPFIWRRPSVLIHRPLRIYSSCSMQVGLHVRRSLTIHGFPTTSFPQDRTIKCCQTWLQSVRECQKYGSLICWRLSVGSQVSCTRQISVRYDTRVN